MGEKDISEKTLISYNDVFADIMNVFVFHGKQVVQPLDLENALVHTQYKAEDGKLHEEERDVAKYWKKEGVAIAFYGVENQVKADKLMPFRIIGYDGASYRSQLLDKSKNIVPVVTFVLYFGTERRWNRETTIKELVEIPDELEPYVNDYKINVIEIAWLKEEQLRMFKSDFGIVANFFVQKRKNKDYEPDDARIIEHVDEVLKLLSVMTGDNEYESILYDENENEEGKVNTMCEVADRLIKKGRMQGIEQGMEQGIEQERLENARNLLDLLSDEVIADRLKLPLDTVKELRSQEMQR